MHIMTTIPSQLPFPQAQLLLHELNHRIGNEFCCAVSVVSLAAARSNNKEVKAALTDVAELLHHYAEAHHALQIPEHGIRTDAAAYLRKLCLSIRRSKLNHMKIDLVLAACRLWLPSDRCWLLGMIVYELITNAARHASAGGRERSRSVNHCCSPAPWRQSPIAARTRLGVIGVSFTSAPIDASASRTAFAIAAGGPMAPPSPKPLTPNSV